MSGVINPIHSVSLTQYLISLYSSDSLTDITITCADETFDLHSPVLSHGSGYFCSVFNKPDGGRSEDELSSSVNLDFIPPIEPHTFRMIVDSLYTGIVKDMNERNVTDILEGSHHLDVPLAKDACELFMLRHLNIDNCLQYWLSARLCDNVKVKNEAIGLIGRHLDEICKTSLFLELQSNTVMDILSNDGLQLSSEVNAYDAAMSWLKYDQESRVGELDTLLESIRFQYLPVKYLVEVVGKEDMIEGNNSAMKKFTRALKSKLGGDESHPTKARHHMMHGMRGGFEKIMKCISGGCK